MTPPQIVISKYNEAFIRIFALPNILMELSDFFTFLTPNHQFHRLVQQKLWDGKIRLLDRRTGLLPAGLWSYVYEFAKTNDYSIATSLEDKEPITTLTEFSFIEAKEYADNLKLVNEDKVPIVPDYYQILGFAKAIRYRRRTLIFPTGGGKSLIAYLIVRYLLEKEGITKLTIIVPTTHLVDQLFQDFKDYSQINGWNGDANIHKIYSGQSKSTSKSVIITTWQSALKQTPEWFTEIQAVIGDEAHICQAKSLIKILGSLVNAKYRTGMTGTLSGEKVHKLVIEGYLGPVLELAKTHELIAKKRLAEIRIKGIILRHPQEICKGVKGFEYPKETEFLTTNPARNKFLINLALSLEGNTLLLFNLIDKHGLLLLDELTEKAKGSRPIFYVDGSVDKDDRNAFRKQTEKETNAILLCSYGTFSVGVNIKNLHNIIFGFGFRGLIRNRQSIGRGLRMGSTKDRLSLYDITDDLRLYNATTKTYGKPNHTLNHFLKRLEIYDEERFPYKTYTVDLKGSTINGN